MTRLLSLLTRAACWMDIHPGSITESRAGGWTVTRCPHCNTETWRGTC